MVAFRRSNNTRSTIRRPVRGTAVRKTIYKKRSMSTYRNKPSRYVASKRQLTQTRAVTRALSQVAETFYNPLADVTDVAINTSTTGSNKVYFKGMTLGQTVPAHLSGYTAINGMDFSTAQGKYAYLKRGQALVTLEVDPTATADSLTYVRLIMYKNKKSMSPAGSIANPNTSLFLNNDGTFIGQDSTGFNGKIAMNSYINKQNFIVYRDHKCILSHEASAYSAKFPCVKKYQLSMPFFKKIQLKADGTPSDIDYHYNILVLVTQQGQEGTPKDMLISLNNHLVTWTDL